jgi:hypothetical protein
METSTAVFLAAWDQNIRNDRARKQAKKDARREATLARMRSLVEAKLDALTDEERAEFKALAEAHKTEAAAKYIGVKPVNAFVAANTVTEFTVVTGIVDEMAKVRKDIDKARDYRARRAAGELTKKEQKEEAVAEAKATAASLAPKKKDSIEDLQSKYDLLQEAVRENKTIKGGKALSDQKTEVQKALLKAKAKNAMKTRWAEAQANAKAKKAEKAAAKEAKAERKAQ